MAGPIVRAQTRISPGRAEFFGARMATHDIGSIDGYFTELRRFTMLSVARQITCRTLIIEAENDFAGGSGRLFRGALTAPAELVHVTQARGADGHCAGLGQEVSAGVVYPWLARTLGGGRPGC